MPAQKLICLAKEARSLMAFCEESLMMLGKHMAARALHPDDMHLQAGTAVEIEPARSGPNHETAKLTRALAEDFRDPEIRRLLCALADKYDGLASPDCESEHIPVAGSWK
jgi:hypothetical protein